VISFSKKSARESSSPVTPTSTMRPRLRHILAAWLTGSLLLAPA
jgi:hypothetical protein